MSAIFEAMQAEFGLAFGAVYRDGTLYRTVQTFGEDGTITEGQTTYPIKGMIDIVTERMRANAGYTEKDVQLIILRSSLSIEPNTDDEILLDGTKWALSDISADPVKAGWVARGTPSG